MAIPAGHIGRIESGQRLRFDDDVLEDLVDCVADVDVAVGVRRPIVKNELRPSFGYFTDALVQFSLLPLLHPARLALGKIPAHRERRIWKVQRIFVVSHLK